MRLLKIAEKLRGGLLVSVAAWLVACGGSSTTPPPTPTAAAPSITTHPAAVTINDGTTATFDVVASGVDLTYQWRRDGAALSNGGGVNGATTATLTLAAPYSANGQEFTAVVSNSAGSVESARARLTVTPVTPVITSHPANSAVASGQSATFSVSVSGGTAPLSYQWKRSGAAIAGAADRSYTLPSATLMDSGATFLVDIINPAGTVSSQAASLMVTAPERTWSAPQRISATWAVQTAGFYGHLTPRVAIDDVGNVTAVYRQHIGAGLATRYALFASRRESGSWQTPFHIVGTDLNMGSPQVAASGNGHVYVAFPQILDTGVFSGFATRYVSGTWQVPSLIESIAANTVDDVHIGVSASGRATAIWNQGDGAFLRVQSNQSDDGGNWSATAQFIDGGAFSTHARIGVGANGHVVAVWGQRVGSEDRLFARRHTGSGWSVPQEIALGTGALLLPPAVAVDANGNAICVISQSSPTTAIVRAVHLDASTGSWSASQPIGIGINPKVAVGASDHFVATWTELNQRVAMTRFAAGIAGEAQLVQAQNTPPGSYPKVGVDAQGGAVIAWLQPRATGHLVGNIYSTRCPANGICSTPQIHTAGGTVDASLDFEHALAVNADGLAAVLWWERAGNNQSAIWASVLDEQ